MLRSFLKCLAAAAPLLGAASWSGAQSTPSTAPAMAAVSPPMLHVVGNELHTPDGKAVWLQGVNAPSLSWTSQGDHLLESVGVALGDWKANVIRLPLNQAMWYGKAKGQADGGVGYRELVDQVIRQCAARKAYAVLDLHWSNTGSWEVNPNQYDMPDALSEQFWRDVATLYKNHPAVLFDLYNEPKDVTWEVWKNGGDVVEDHFHYHTCGMQALIELVRATGAKNIVIVGGLDWAYDLTGVLNGYELKDPSGNGIMYSAHIYEWKTDWDGKVLAAAKKHPVFLGEIGCDVRHQKVYPDRKCEDPYTWAPAMLGYIQAHKLNWAAWSFHIDATPRLIADWDYTPTPFWGGFVRSALRGGQFACDRPR